MSSEQVLTYLNVLEFMPETATYHFIFRVVKKISVQVSQDEIPERMHLMGNREKDTLCSFHFSHHIRWIINVIILSTKITKPDLCTSDAI